MLLRAPGLQMSVLNLRTMVPKEINKFLIRKPICNDFEVFQDAVNSLTLCLQFLTAAVVQMLVWNLWLIFCLQMHVNQGERRKITHQAQFYQHNSLSGWSTPNRRALLMTLLMFREVVLLCQGKKLSQNA